MGGPALDLAPGAPRAALAALVAAAGASCSLLVDPDRLRAGGGEIDARLPPFDAGPDFDAHIDAEPGALQAFGMVPAFVFEGSGAEPGAPPVAIVIGGLNLDDATTVTCDDPRVEVVGPTLASSDGTLLGTAIRLAVDASLADGVDDEILLVVRKGEETGDVELVVRGLDEKTLAGELSIGQGTLRPRYSRITVTGAASLRGASALPARLVATASISIGAPLDVDGRIGGQTPAGGCAGGGSAAAGSCAGGGAAGEAGGGGGGGGHVIAGTGGAGGGGAGGVAVDDRLLVPLDLSAGSGGGGGGEGSIGGAGGAGGAGGGVIFLDSGGGLTLGAEVSARGGAGGAGGNCAVGLNASGGGGGGAGGALLFRAAGVLGGSAVVAVSGGPGDPDCQAGGGGASGRVRVDHPGVDLPGGLATVGATRGPMWAADAVVVTDDPAYTLTLFGGANQPYEVHVSGGETSEIQTAVNQRAEVQPALAAGLNQVCALAVPDLTQLPPEAETCRAVAYLP